MTKAPASGLCLKWNITEIPFDRIDKNAIRDDEFLFLTLASASFVEILAETFTENLIEHFREDAQIVAWLAHCWQREEVQHGRALKAYVQAVWPEFEWDRAYEAFRTEYSLLCTTEQLEPSRALELIARCVVETGTSSFYRALQQYASEPVLQQLLGNIKSDEVAHFNFFRHFFAGYQEKAPQGISAVFGTIWRRLRNIRNEDAYIAFKHVYTGRHRERPFNELDWQRYNQTVKRLARNYYPYTMAITMLIKPIPMPRLAKRALHWPLMGLARLVSIG